MKKFSLALVTILLAFIAVGQDVDPRVSKLRGSLDVILDVEKNETFYFQHPRAILDTVDNVWDITIGVDNVFDLTKQYCLFTLDSVSGTPSVTVTTYGKLFWVDEWTTIDTVEWAGSSADTTFKTDNTAAAYRFYKAEAVADTAGNFQWKVSKFETKLFK